MSTDTSVKARTLFNKDEWTIVRGKYVTYCYAIHTGCKLVRNSHPSDNHAMVPGKATSCGRCHTDVSNAVYALVKLLNWDETDTKRTR